MLIGYLIPQICSAWEGIATETITGTQAGVRPMVYLGQIRFWQALPRIQPALDQWDIMFLVTMGVIRLIQ